MKLFCAVLASAMMLSVAGYAQTAQPVLPTASITARKELSIVGGSRLRPMMDALSPRLAARYKLPPPDIRLDDSGPAITALCAGIGPDHPDIAVVPRRMLKSEFDRCQQAGVFDIIELEIGHGAFVAVVKPDAPFDDISSRALYLALAAEVPEDHEEFRANNFKRWREVHPRLPDLDIKLFGPMRGVGSRSIFEALVMENGCRGLKAVDYIFSAEQRFKQCSTVRGDGAFVENPEPTAVTAVEQMLKAPAGAIALTSYAVYLQNMGRLKALSVSGVRPEMKSFRDDSYEWTSSFYAYFKRGHMRDKLGRGVVKGIREFMEEVLSEEAGGEKGYLAQSGMIPLDRADRLAELAKARRLERFSR